jgi:hypothetical protein
MEKIALRCVLDAGAWPKETTASVVSLARDHEIASRPSSPLALENVDPAILNFILDLAKDTLPIVPSVLTVLLNRAKETSAKQIRFECGREQITLPASATPEQIAEASKRFAKICADAAGKHGDTI